MLLIHEMKSSCEFCAVGVEEGLKMQPSPLEVSGSQSADPRAERHWERARDPDTPAPANPLSQKLGLGPVIWVFTRLPGGSDTGLSLRTTDQRETGLDRNRTLCQIWGASSTEGGSLQAPPPPHAGGVFVLRTAGRHRQEAGLAPRMGSLGPALQWFPHPPPGLSSGEGVELGARVHTLHPGQASEAGSE